jgi:hypothetical protein
MTPESERSRLRQRTTSERDTIPITFPSSTTGAPLIRFARRKSSSAASVSSGGTERTFACITSRARSGMGAMR